MKNRIENRAVRARRTVLDYFRGSGAVGSPEEEAEKASERIIRKLHRERESAREEIRRKQQPAA